MANDIITVHCHSKAALKAFKKDLHLSPKEIYGEDQLGSIAISAENEIYAKNSPHVFKYEKGNAFKKNVNEGRITLREFVDKLNLAVDPSRSADDRRIKSKHGIDVIDNSDEHIDDTGIDIKKSKRLADYLPGDDEEVYEAFKPGKVVLNDKSTYKLTQEQSDALNKMLDYTKLPKDKADELVKTLMADKAKFEETIDFAASLK